MRPSPPARAAAVVATAILLGGCFTYTSVQALPPSGTRVAVSLNDHGRIGLAPRIGPEVDRLEATMLRATDTAYILQVSEIVDLSGIRTQFGGAQVTVRPEYVKSVAERRLSRRRTLVATAAAAGAAAWYIASRGLFGFGEQDQPGNGGGGNET